MKCIWEVANDIESLNCRISNIKDILELVAEDTHDPYSGALWSARDMVEDLCNKLDEKVQDLMEIHRETKQIEPPKKGKKK